MGGGLAGGVRANVRMETFEETARSFRVIPSLTSKATAVDQRPKSRHTGSSPKLWSLGLCNTEP